MKRILIGSTNDSNDCTATGYTIEVGRQRDGNYMLVLTYHTRWQGSRDGNCWQVRGIDSKDDACEQGKEMMTWLTGDRADVVESALQQSKNEAQGVPSDTVTWDGRPIVYVGGGSVVR